MIRHAMCNKLRCVLHKPCTQINKHMDNMKTNAISDRVEKQLSSVDYYIGGGSD